MKLPELPIPSAEVWRRDKWLFITRVWFALVIYPWFTWRLLHDDLRGSIKVIGIWLAGALAIVTFRVMIEAVRFLFKWKRMRKEVGQ